MTGFVVEVVCSLGKHLNTGVLHLGQLVGSFLEGFGLLNHNRPMPPDLLGQCACMQTTIDGEAQVAAFEVVAQALEVVIDGLVGIVIALHTPI